MTTGDTCVTPCTLKLKRKTAFVATITKQGYKPAQVNVTSEIRGGGVAGAAGNILVGGIIGGIVDGSNGSMKDLRPNPIDVTLELDSVPGPIVTPSVSSPADTTAPKQ